MSITLGVEHQIKEVPCNHTPTCDYQHIKPDGEPIYRVNGHPVDAQTFWDIRGLLTYSSPIPHPRRLGSLISRALGLDPERLAGLSFDWTPGNVGVIQAKHYVTTEQGEHVGEVLKRYRLVEIEEEQEAQPDDTSPEPQTAP